MHPNNPNVRIKQTPQGTKEYVDPFEDLAEMLFSRNGALAVVGADILVNGGGLIGAGMELFGEFGEAVGEMGEAL
jgi:hypothetical protein